MALARPLYLLAHPAKFDQNILSHKLFFFNVRKTIANRDPPPPPPRQKSRPPPSIIATTPRQQSRQPPPVNNRDHPPPRPPPSTIATTHPPRFAHVCPFFSSSMAHPLLYWPNQNKISAYVTGIK